MRHFVYCRKSSEPEDRQVLSTESQIAELKNKLVNQLEFEIVDIFEEAYSAKAPDRPVFDAMMQRIENNEADGSGNKAPPNPVGDLSPKLGDGSL